MSLFNLTRIAIFGVLCGVVTNANQIKVIVRPERTRAFNGKHKRLRHRRTNRANLFALGTVAAIGAVAGAAASARPTVVIPAPLAVVGTRAPLSQRPATKIVLKTPGQNTVLNLDKGTVNEITKVAPGIKLVRSHAI